MTSPTAYDYEVKLNQDTHIVPGVTEVRNSNGYWELMVGTLMVEAVPQGGNNTVRAIFPQTPSEDEEE